MCKRHRKREKTKPVLEIRKHYPIISCFWEALNDVQGACPFTLVATLDRLGCEKLFEVPRHLGFPYDVLTLLKQRKQFSLLEFYKEDGIKRCQKNHSRQGRDRDVIFMYVLLYASCGNLWSPDFAELQCPSSTATCNAVSGGSELP